MSTRNRVFLGVASVLVGMGLGVVGMLSTRPKPVYVSPYTPGATPPPVPEPSAKPIVERSGQTPGQEDGKASGARVTYYKVAEGAEGPVLRPITLAVDGAVVSDDARLSAAIVAMTQGDEAVLPKGTKLLRLKRDGALALLDMSRELKVNFDGGERGERLAVNALLALAGQLAGVEKVQIFVDGEAIETLAGGQSLLEPLSVPKAP